MNKVDGQYFDHEPWYMWELFGAYFYAARINALLMLVAKEVEVKRIFQGALVNGGSELVKLRPVKVFRTSEPSTPARIPEAGNEEYTRDWVRGDGGSVGAIVVNGSGGKGADIFFALVRAHGPGFVFFVEKARGRRQGGDEGGERVGRRGAARRS